MPRRRRPSEERPLRVAFAGDRLRFASWALSAPAGGIQPAFVDHAARGARQALEAFAPHVVVAFDVDAAQPALWAGLGAAVLGVATQAPERAAPSAWDRLVALDWASAAGRPLWQLLVPPVDDRLFAAPRRPGAGPHARALFAGPSTAHRERLLTDAKHAHDILHVAHGVTPETLPGLLARADVAIALHAEEEPGGFEHAVALHLAAGQLVVCDRQTPSHGLEPGIDVLEIRDGRSLVRAVGAVRKAPDVHHRVRVRGRQKAERFRASRVWPALVGDLLADLDAFG